MNNNEPNFTFTMVPHYLLEEIKMNQDRILNALSSIQQSQEENELPPLNQSLSFY
ncbi:MAG: hypothetical protein ACNS62_11040 [Candidatus Cyclobacteriaceae bacterium M3_2C_046]